MGVGAAQYGSRSDTILFNTKSIYYKLESDLPSSLGPTNRQELPDTRGGRAGQGTCRGDGLVAGGASRRPKPAASGAASYFRFGPPISVFIKLCGKISRHFDVDEQVHFCADFAGSK